MDVEKAVSLLADEAERLGAECNDEAGIVRALVQMHGFGFEAWFCVCIELANREAKAEGYQGTVDRAYKKAVAKVRPV